MTRQSPIAAAAVSRAARGCLRGRSRSDGPPPLPDGSPYGDGIELPFDSWEDMQERERANLMGVLTGNDVMIGGFVIQGDSPQTVVVRDDDSALEFELAKADVERVVTRDGRASYLARHDPADRRLCRPVPARCCPLL